MWKCFTLKREHFTELNYNLFQGCAKVKYRLHVVHSLCSEVVAVEYAIRKDQQNWEELELNGTHEVLVCSDEVNSLAKNKSTVKEHRSFVRHKKLDRGIETAIKPWFDEGC
jgi:hypothetical protein